jgi:hypothetical protein
MPAYNILGQNMIVFGDKDDHHQTQYIRVKVGDKWFADCKCGLEWTVGKEKGVEYLQSIWESHKAYFNKPETKVL